MVTDSTLAARQTDLYDAVVLPGGPQGSVNLAASEAVIQFIAPHDEAGKLICPVCSAAARVLGGNGLLKGVAMCVREICGKTSRMENILMRRLLKMAILLAAKG